MSEITAILNARNDLQGELKERILKYFESDFRQETKKETIELAKNESPEKLSKLFLHRLEFGTAGLRASMGCGFNQINDVTVEQTTQGVAHYLIAKYGTETCGSRGVVIGFDGRHNSKRYAHVTAAVFLTHRFRVYLMKEVTPTPTNPFAILKYKCLAGIQITASHNPKNDNGYKLYAENGAQIIPPTDSEISNLIEKTLGSHDKVLALLHPESGLLLNQEKLVISPDDEVRKDYINTVVALCPNQEKTASSDLKIVYTAMHGVGYSYIHQVLSEIGCQKNFYSVKEQQDPDPEFSTVLFPNPEEPGALDLAISYANSINSPMVIANDPDADRFACAEKQRNGEWKIFSGNELGILLGYTMFQRALKQGIPKNKMLFIASAVSSRMLQKLAETEGCQFADTMTGFKWIMNCAIDLRENKKYIPVFSYEEALGYACSMSVPDKDGISAAAIWVETFSDLHLQKKTATDLLKELQNKYGTFVSFNSYVKFDDKSAMESSFTKLRNEGKYLSEIGNLKINRIRDVTTGYDSGEPGNVCTFQKTPLSQMITFFFDNGDTVLTLRVSGTEPKLKYYSETNGKGSTEELLEKLKKLVKSTLGLLNI